LDDDDDGDGDEDGCNEPGVLALVLA